MNTEEKFMMKKVLSVLLCVAMVATLLVGCGDTAATEPAAEGEVAASEGVFPAVAKEDLKVGVIHITDPAEGSGYT
jgi:basic membrane protein A and related proteins